MPGACVPADVEADFTMHLGRSGEAYFVGEDDVVGESAVILWHSSRHAQ